MHSTVRTDKHKITLQSVFGLPRLTTAPAQRGFFGWLVGFF